MTPYCDNFDRRQLLNWGSQGLAATAVAHLLGSEGSARGDADNPPFAPRARRAIQISLVGGMSHVDSFDHKAELDRHHGQSLKSDAVTGPSGSEAKAACGSPICSRTSPGWPTS